MKEFKTRPSQKLHSMMNINSPHNKKIFSENYHKILTKIPAKVQYSYSNRKLERKMCPKKKS